MDGARVMVTGGGRGLGLHLARALAARGARPVLVGRDARRLEAAAASIPGATWRAADLSDRGAVDDVVAWCREAHPDLSGLINNAAVQVEGALLGADDGAVLGDLRRELALDLEAPMALSVGLLPLLRGRRDAFVCNVTSGLAFAPKAAAPGYSAAKAGLRAFTRALRDQCAALAPDLLVSEAILPMLETDMTAGRGRGKMAPEAAAAEIVAGLARGAPEIWIGKAKLLRVLRVVAPGLPARILRGPVPVAS